MRLAIDEYLCIRSVLVKWILVSFLFIVILLLTDYELDAETGHLTNVISSAGIGRDQRPASRLISADEFQETYEKLVEKRPKSSDSAQSLIKMKALDASMAELATLPAFQNLRIRPGSVYQKFISKISSDRLFDGLADRAVVDELMKSLATSRIVGITSAGSIGTQMKFVFQLEDGTFAAAKPMRMQREEEIPRNLYYFSEFERHHSEIAAFHLDRLFGFDRAAPCVGRLVNITSEMLPILDDQLTRTVNRSPAGNICFFGDCKYFCDPHHPFCGDPDSIEMSICALLPIFRWQLAFIENPWRRTYSPRKAAEWQQPGADASFCSSNNTAIKDLTEKRLLDIIDIHVLDFLMANLDRHHLEYFSAFGNDSALLLLDNGRGFGTSIDAQDILAPIYQCCRMRKSTFNQLLQLSYGRVHLSSLMRHSLSSDPLANRAPLLAEKYLRALDRRVIKILNTFRDCARSRGLDTADIVVDDGK